MIRDKDRVINGDNKQSAMDHLQAGESLDGRRTMCWSLAVFSVFLLYYFITSSLLPIGAGPDYAATNDVVRFIYEHERLAVIPEDEDKLYYSPYGGTRALRPPLPYIIAAGAAKLLDNWVDDRNILFRKGSSLLAAGAVAISFYTATVYFNSYLAGLIAAMLLGLLPQFVFIASYANDDAAAIFSATLMISALVRTLRKGTSWANIIFVSLAGGLVVLSKQTAWILAPTVAIFLAVYVRVARKTLIRYASAGVLVFFLSGGWWLVFNVYHYGFDDPFLMKTQAKVAERHSRFDADTVFGYSPLGIGYVDLVLENHDNFWQKTIASAIGNLDWLRIRLGPWQYGLYLAMFVLAGAYVLIRVAGSIWNAIRRGDGDTRDRDIYFEMLLAFAALVQFHAYVWVNIHNDIQLQGKYLLPVVLAAVLMAIAAVRAALIRTVPVLMGNAPRDVRLRGAMVQRGGVAAVAAAVVWIHVDAVVSYVMPFYKPAVYELRLKPGSDTVEIPELSIVYKNHMERFEVTDDGFVMDTSDSDPWFVVDLDESGSCRMFRGHNILTATLWASHASVFQLYVDKGFGLREADSYSVRYPEGQSRIMLVFDVPRCSKLRFDPAARAMHLEITDLSLDKIEISE